MPTNKQCHTFRSLGEFRTFQSSPAGQLLPGDGAGSGGAVPLWRVELLRRPLRLVIGWKPYTVPGWKRLPSCEMYRETLECGHKMNRFMTWDPPAKRRRCRECGRRA